MSVNLTSSEVLARSYEPTHEMGDAGFKPGIAQLLRNFSYNRGNTMPRSSQSLVEIISYSRLWNRRCCTSGRSRSEPV